MGVHSVLFVVSFSFPGNTGTPLHAMGIAKSMHNRGLDVHIAQLRPWPLFKCDSDEWEGIPVHRIARPGWRRNLCKYLKDIRPEVVHAHHILAAVFSLEPCRRACIPLIYECHSFWKEEIVEEGKGFSPVMRYVAWKEHDVFSKCDHVIALSDKMKRTHIEEMGIHERKISVIYPGVKSEWINKNGNRQTDVPGISNNDFVAMYCGNFASYQGVDLLLSGLSAVFAKVPHLKVVLVGAKENENEGMKKKYGDYNGRVIYLGRYPYDEMKGLMARADVLLIPRPNWRICWTMPRKFGEYLSAGKPLLVTDVGDHRSIVEHFQCGYVTDCTPEGIAQGLVYIAEMPTSEREVLGHNALKAAREYFDWTFQSDKLLKIYYEVKPR